MKKPDYSLLFIAFFKNKYLLTANSGVNSSYFLKFLNIVYVFLYCGFNAVVFWQHLWHCSTLVRNEGAFFMEHSFGGFRIHSLVLCFYSHQ